MPYSPSELEGFEKAEVRLEGYRHVYRSVVPDAPTSPPVIAIHGFGTSGFRTYRHVARQFQRTGIPLYALDLLGFGESEIVDTPYSLELYARLVRVFADVLELERPVIMGHSMGGKIAVATATSYRDSFTGMVLVNSGGFARGERMLPFVARSWWARKLLAQDWFYYRLLPRTPFGPILQTEENRAQLAMLHRSHAALDLKRSGYREKLRDLKLPTLVLWGERDDVLPRSTPYRVQRHIPHAHLRFIADAGHAPMKDQPDRFVQTLAPFVRSL